MLEIRSPFDQAIIQEISFNSPTDVEEALDVAHNLFLDQDNWLPPYERIAILNRVADTLQENLEEITRLAASEGGKPMVDSRAEVLRAINGVQLAASSIGQLKGEQIPMGITKASINRLGVTVREPIGVVVSISAFNHPLNLIVHQVVTAIAAGCPVIIKPALTTPLSAIKLVEIIHESGLPKDWCQLLICEDELSEKLATDSRVAYLSFIGSAKVGWYLKSKLSPGTRCALEHGGAAPVIVEKDAEIKEMLPLLVKGGFYHAGQVCVSVQRIFVHEDIVLNVANGIADLAKNLVVGNQLNENTDVGPLILSK